MKSPCIIAIRSLVFNICFIGWAMLSAILFSPLFFMSSKTSLKVGSPWGKVSLFLARLICGITYEVRGQQHAEPNSEVSQERPPLSPCSSIAAPIPPASTCRPFRSWN